MENLRKTILYDEHIRLGAQMVTFGGWEMPVQYPSGIITEHLNTRKEAGLFDVSHMGRFVVRGQDALPFLQHVLTNNAAGLDVEESQYTLIPDESGGALDDAYLYRFVEDEYFLVVNAANRDKDWQHFQLHAKHYNDLELVDLTDDMAMLSLQGPASKQVLSNILTAGCLPEPMRNMTSIGHVGDVKIFIAKTGYTGEPLCFELFMNSLQAPKIWKQLLDEGAYPIGLGARDTLRLEAGLPLYGHELGTDPENKPIPIFACSLARFAVSLSPLKADFIGKKELSRQFEALKEILDRNYSHTDALPRLIQPVALLGKGIARAGDKVFHSDKLAGYVTSGTMVPFWHTEGEGIDSRLTDETGRRAICLALIDSRLIDGERVEIDIRGRKVQGVVVPYHLRGEAPPFARPIAYDHLYQPKHCQVDTSPGIDPQTLHQIQSLISKTVANTHWRQRECINLIPSEQTASPMARLMSIMDPAGRYAEHKSIKAFSEQEVFYYQGTEFISEVEEQLQCELRSFLGCLEVETRLVSGQMANTAVFSALVDFLNRADRKSEQRRIRQVLNHHIIKGGHLSAQPMGALRDFVRRDPQTEKPAVVNFPVKAENPYQVDVEACYDIIDRFRPELIIFGKSMVLHKEPVREIRAMVDELSLNCILMYDMAHVLGLVGPYFQQPFEEGADIVTGSTHKTFFGTQRGIVACHWDRENIGYELWEAIQRRSFPGSVSNHHLGTLLGLLMAAYEMNHFKDEYQQKVISNAKAFAKALKDVGLDVAGDPNLSFTETHQVILNVGYAKGAEIASRLEDNNIIVNYQAAPDEEGFTASGSIRMGVSEMTRFGMEEQHFSQLAEFLQEVIVAGKEIKQEVAAFRAQFQDLQFCFQHAPFDDLLQDLHQLI
jgi:aminomethyltransferase